MGHFDIFIRTFPQQNSQLLGRSEIFINLFINSLIQQTCIKHLRVCLNSVLEARDNIEMQKLFPASRCL